MKKKEANPHEKVVMCPDCNSVAEHIARDKFLTEVMGECWHEWKDTGWENYETIRIGCKKCGVDIPKRHKESEINNFSTWQGFGKLWEWAIKQEWWEGFLSEYCIHRNYILSFLEPLINPDRFADALYEYLQNINVIKVSVSKR